LVVTGLLLLLYPLIFVAAIMSLSGFTHTDSPALLVIVGQTFIWLTVAYPLVYVFALYLYIREKSSRYRSLFAYVPVFYLVLCAVFFSLWLFAEEYYFEPIEFSGSYTDEEFEAWLKDEMPELYQ